VGAALLYGWHAATIVAFTTRGAIELIARRPFVRFAYNSSVYALGGVAAGLAAGASPAHGQVLGPLAAVALAAAAFYAVNVVLIAAVIAVSSRQAFFALLGHTTYWTAIPFAIMASVSLMLNVLWEQSPVFAAALAGPLNRNPPLPALRAPRARGDAPRPDRSADGPRESPPFPGAARERARAGGRGRRAADGSA